IAKIYLDTLSATEQFSLQQEAAEKLQRRVEIVHQRASSRLDTQADKLSAQAALAEKNADLNAARRLSALNRMQLALALGQQAQAQIEITAVAENFPSTPAIEETLAATLETQPALRAQMASWNVAKATLESQRAERLPKVVFDVSRMEAGDFYTQGTNRFVSAGVKLSMPLIDFGVNAKVRARNFEAGESEQKMLQMRSTLIENAYQAYYAYQNAVDMFEAGKAALAKAELQEQESTAKYNKKLSNLATLLQDEAAAVAVRVNQVKLRYQAWSAWADYIKSLGRPYSSALVMAAQ
ncbi:MAG: TolC family protein, partial [Gallionellaceae bacterium]|nr:TolC family protein [Gallionellaceae bacterium]